jgi:Phage tail lysozyme/LysM domain
MAAPVVVASGAMAVVPAFMTAAPHVAAVAQTSPHTITTSPRTITAHLDAVVKPATPAARSYTVQPGDTLYGIAQRYWGNGKYWPALYQANRSKISDPNLIYAGQVMTVPSGRHQASSAPAPSTPTSSTPTSSTPTSSTPTSSTSASSTWEPSTADSASSASSRWPSSGSASSTSHPSSTSIAASSKGGTSTTSSSSASSTVQSDIANGNNLLAIGQYLVDNGYSKAAAAGVASCVDGESGGNPESVGSGGGGLIGWTPLSSAAPNANIVTGNASADMLTQLADILYYNSHEIGASQVAELNSQTDPVAAADFFSQHFEKPAVTDSDVQPSVAEQVFSELGG